MLAISPPRPRFVVPLFHVMLVALATLATWALTRPAIEPHPLGAFSAFGVIHRAYCGPTDGRFVPNALQHDAYGNPYMFECNTRGFTVVSAGPDGIYGTSDDTRSDR